MDLIHPYPLALIGKDSGTKIRCDNSICTIAKTGDRRFGIGGPADRRSAKKSRVQPATWGRFAYIHSATSAKLWIYGYQEPPGDRAAD